MNLGFDYNREYSLKHTFDHYARLNGTQQYEYKFVEICRCIHESNLVFDFQVDQIEEYTGIPVKKYLLDKSEAYFPVRLSSWTAAKKYLGRSRSKSAFKLSGDSFLQALRNMT